MVSAFFTAALASGAAAEAAKPAEPGPWKFGSTALLALSQSSFSSNWAGGDRGSIVWVFGADASAERQLSGSFNHSNHLVLAYGQTTRQTPSPAGDLRWDAPDKSTDKIEFESIGRWTLHTFVDPYFALRLDSQFLDQSSPYGNLNLNPIKLKETAGVARVLRKTEDSETISRLGFGFRQILARSFTDALTRQTKSFTGNDGGFEWQTSATQPLLGKKVLYKGQLLVFQPIFYSKSDALVTYDDRVIAGDGTRLPEPAHRAVADFWKAADVSFQNSFTAEITKHLGVALFAQFVYDKFDAAANVDNGVGLADLVQEIRRNTRRAGQFKETLALTVSYRLF